MIESNCVWGRHCTLYKNWTVYPKNISVWWSTHRTHHVEVNHVRWCAHNSHKSIVCDGRFIAYALFNWYELCCLPNLFIACIKLWQISLLCWSIHWTWFSKTKRVQWITTIQTIGEKAIRAMDHITHTFYHLNIMCDEPPHCTRFLINKTWEIRLQWYMFP